MSAHSEILRLREQVGAAIIGQSEMVDRMVVGLLAGGHLLVEGLPGLAKTRAVKELARNLEADLSRIQFTPDLLPGDVTGTEIYHATGGGGGEFRYQPGPIFANLVLADEVNRAPAKVQAALLEAMEERQVTVAGQTHPLPELFMVMATQNPIEQEGTYPLPEAQMDRFMMKVLVDYPDEAAEARVIELVRSERKGGGDRREPVAQASVLEARNEIDRVQMAEPVLHYIVELVFATRTPERYSDELAGWISLGASPRAGIHLDRGSRAHAWLDGRDYTTPEDVRAILHDVLRHRVSLSYEASADGLGTEQVIDRIAALVAVPLSDPMESGAYVSIRELVRLRHAGRGLSLLPRQPLRSQLAGLHASRLRGRGLDFDELRAYLPGDDVRDIDWKVTARMQTPHVRVFHEERDRRTLFLVDQRINMFFGSQVRMKSVAAAQAAALGIWRVLAQGDRPGAIVFNDSDQVEISPHRSQARALAILAQVERMNHALRVDGGQRTDPAQLNRVLERAIRLAGHDHLIVLVSDLDGLDDDTPKLMNRLARHNDVVVLLVHDPLERELPDASLLVVSDGELQLEIDARDPQLRSGFQQVFEDQVDTGRKELHKRSIPMLPISTDQPVVAQLRDLLGRGAA